MNLSEQCLQFAALFDCVDDVLAWIKDREGRYGWVNRAFLINYALERGPAAMREHPDDIVGKTDYDFSPAFLADQFRADDEYVLTGRRIVNRIEMVQQPGGPTFWNVTNKIPLSDGNGSIVGTAGVTRRLEPAGRQQIVGREFGPVLAYFRDHYQEVVTNERLARLAHMSVRSFERKFHRTFHLTPQAYLRKLRLRVASRWLVHGRQTLAEVAAACGFADQSHFTRVFRRQFGVTPRVYRDRHTGGDEVAGPVPKSAASRQERKRPASL
jgi:AraC-like DNA-binding protein